MLRPPERNRMSSDMETPSTPEGTTPFCFLTVGGYESAKNQSRMLNILLLSSDGVIRDLDASTSSTPNFLYQ